MGAFSAAREIGLRLTSERGAKATTESGVTIG